MIWTNTAIPYTFGSEIVEWDIESGNTSIMEQYDLASMKWINRIRSLPKEQRLVEVGLLQKKKPDLKKKLEKGFNEVVELFINANHLDKERDIVSIKRDAVYVKNHDITCATFAPAVTFRPKGVYHSYIYLSPCEIYIGNTGIDVKGIDDAKLPDHQNGILKFIRDICEMMRFPNPTELVEYLHSVADAYKKRELPLEWYREFNATSSFRAQMYTSIILLSAISENDLELTDISHNYLKVIMPIIQYLT